MLFYIEFILLNLAETKKVKRLEPDSADYSVSCYSDLECSFSSIVGAVNMRDCCLGQGLSFSPFSEVCTTCVGKFYQCKIMFIFVVVLYYQAK